MNPAPSKYITAEVMWVDKLIKKEGAG